MKTFILEDPMELVRTSLMGLCSKFVSALDSSTDFITKDHTGSHKLSIRAGMWNVPPRNKGVLSDIPTAHLDVKYENGDDQSLNRHFIVHFYFMSAERQIYAESHGDLYGLSANYVGAPLDEYFKLRGSDIFVTGQIAMELIKMIRPKT